MSYQEFLDSKCQLVGEFGFEPIFMPSKLFDFQKHLVAWSCKKGRSALFADCGMGKTFMQLVWAENCARKENGRVIVLTPLAVADQTITEAEKIGVESVKRKNGIKTGDRIVVTNYERLHYFDPKDFIGIVCDESSILKNYDGIIKEAITSFARKMKYRMLCTATAAPNDYIELGTSSEALGHLGYIDMLAKFFKADNDSYAQGGGGGGRFDKNPFGSKFRFRGHAERDFWRWVCSWARAVKKPSDLGFDDGGFVLPEMIVQDHIVEASTVAEGYLFDLPASNLHEQRKERKRSLEDRVAKAAEIINNREGTSVAWCHFNDESELLKSMIEGAIEVKGSDKDEKKEERLKAFSNGECKCIVTKPSIAGFGLNWQHCSHQTYFPSHSYEQFYQATRRSWRFGQKNNVEIDLISTPGQETVLSNLKRKSKLADEMFERLVELMSNELKIEQANKMVNKEEVPSWL